ncbi:bifunctional UDP-N-acetylglucosamine diphosphorylase/glucosamine-1-phosphate N-acetyltransferase GlmU [Lutispora sp.]|nr:bifunctional UDP-N-acetylglucosamine diphosphorylase/glucosamine-1-phosphate N-acetyltransferase GlmU [Lutispora sp.]MEA4961278.1 bifunctional UDP-N-acetylglucosamine diphosphorylase/glucosamine-1-phosphate N-acetyltransferase GlmU [Lutispora sp.]HCJ57845.1 bifunctional UDP-N-acetylglucosamine diphosphorylase/glucosamine-1-phosphate N-acetyltransferase GlmU [Clostridiaceae bacterium]
MLAVILAAGEGKRMYSKRPKVLHELCGKAMVEHVVGCAREAGASETVVVVGHGAAEVRDKLAGVKFVYQEQQLGTGHAVMQAESFITSGDVLVLYGDTPLLTSETISKMYKAHKQGNCHATVLTADFEDPYNYGRIIRDAEGNVAAIVEERDADSEQKKIREINSGIYLFDGPSLKEALKGLKNDNDQKEYYLTDAIKILNEKNLNVRAFKIENSEEIMGVNNRLQLSQAVSIMTKRILEKHMLSGVTITDPANTYIEAGVKIERDVTILPGCILKGSAYVEEDAIIGPYTTISDSHVGKGAHIQNSVVLESRIGEGTTVGPFAYLRPGNVIGRHAKIGDFVEMKNSNFGDHSKASHLTYVGDGDVGSGVNLGCGVVFVNYDGKKKHRTKVEDNSFVGCNVNLVAPVVVGKNSYIAAGTTVTRSVPEESLAIGRARQENIEGWVRRKGLIKEEE